MDYVPNSSAFFDEFLGTAILVIGLLAILDKRNMGAPTGLAPVALFILVVGIGTGLGMQTGDLSVLRLYSFPPKLVSIL